MKMFSSVFRIMPGEEICHIYQGHFADTSLEKRQKILQDFFHFKCTCKACQDNYPIYENLSEELESPEYIALATEAQGAFDSEDYDLAMHVLIKRLKILSDNVQEPHKFLIRDRAAFLEALWQCYGNKTFIVKDSVK